MKKTLRTWTHRALAILAIATIAATGAAAPRATAAPLDDLLVRARKHGIDADDLVRLVDDARRRGMTEADATGLAETVVETAEDDLPAMPVYDRIRQGLVKNAPSDRITDVVTHLRRKLRVGAALVDGSLAEAAGARALPPGDPGSRSRLVLIDQTTFAIEKGVPETSIAAVFSDLKPEDSEAPADVLAAMQSPVVALTSFAAEGVPPEQGLKFVTEAYRNGCRNQDLEMMAMVVAHAPPPDRDRIAGFIREQLREGHPPREILGHIRDRMGLPPPPPGMGPGDRLRPGPGGENRPPIDPGNRRGRGNRGGGRGGNR